MDTDNTDFYDLHGFVVECPVLALYLSCCDFKGNHPYIYTNSGGHHFGKILLAN